jgi:uncharacterized secreted protein with C-terminal beta-propeller domain
VVAASGVATAGCGPRGGAGPEENRAVVERVALQAFDSCEALEQYVEDTAVSQMKADLAALKSNGWGGWGGWWRFGGSEGVPVSAPAGGAVNAGAPGPSEHTTTNTQVAGVDEADFVKNDGTRIFVLTGSRLHAVKSWPAAELSLQGSLAVEGWPREMFLAEGGRVVVFSAVDLPEWRETTSSGGGTGGGAADASSMPYGYYGTNAVKVTTVDASDPAAMRVVREEYLPGDYVSARRVDGSVRVVLRDDVRYPPGVRMHPEWREGVWQTEGQWHAAVDALVGPNEQAIRARTLAQWLPAGRRRGADGQLREVPYRCGDVHASNAPTRLGLATVATLGLGDASGEVQRTTVVGEVGGVYASADALYLASSHWWWWPQPGQTDATYLHKFDIRNPARAVYVASGTVAGRIKDQFSLDEHGGFLRVATTEARRVEDPREPRNTWGVLETVSRVSVLAEREGRLVLHGKTGELAPGERIFAVRFLGERGFVVTFRQVDPLFAVDLSDPAAPRVAGELKIPGFSTYLHPVDANHLVGVGEDRDADGNWTSRRLKLSLYDVSDLSAPREKFTHVLGTASSSSEALYDHKAFNYFASRGTLAIPFTDWSYSYDGSTGVSRSVSELRVFQVDVEAGFTPKGALAVGDLFLQQHQGGSWSWSQWWQPAVRRSVMADDFVYAISDAGIRVARVDSLETPVATVPLPRADVVLR